MGTHETNDDGAMGLERFDEMTGPMEDHSAAFDSMMGHAKQAGMRLSPYAPPKVAAVIRDEQRMADVFAECALVLEAIYVAQAALNLGHKASIQTLNMAADVLGRAAQHLESAIVRANGGAE